MKKAHKFSLHEKHERFYRASSIKMPYRKTHESTVAASQQIKMSPLHSLENQKISIKISQRKARLQKVEPSCSEFSQKKNILRKSCEQITTRPTFLNSQWNQIIQLQRQLKQIIISTVQQKNRKSILQKLIVIMRTPNINQQNSSCNTSNPKYLQRLISEINDLTKQTNHHLHENKKISEQILLIRKNRVQFSQIFHNIQKLIKSHQFSFLQSLGQVQHLKKSKEKNLNIHYHHPKEKIQTSKQSEFDVISINKTNQNLHSKKLVSIKNFIEKQSGEEDEQLLSNISHMKSCRFQTFKSIWIRHERAKKNKKINNSLAQDQKQIHDLITNKIFNIHSSLADQIDCYLLSIQKVGNQLEIPFKQLLQYLQEQDNKTSKLSIFNRKQQNSNLRKQLAKVDREIQVVMYKFEELKCLVQLKNIKKKQLKDFEAYTKKNQQNSCKQSKENLILKDIMNIFIGGSEEQNKQNKISLYQLEQIIETIMEFNNQTSIDKKASPKSPNLIQITNKYNQIFKQKETYKSLPLKKHRQSLEFTKKPQIFQKKFDQKNIKYSNLSKKRMEKKTVVFENKLFEENYF